MEGGRRRKCKDVVSAFGTKRTFQDRRSMSTFGHLLTVALQLQFMSTRSAGSTAPWKDQSEKKAFRFHLGNVGDLYQCACISVAFD